MQNSTFKPSESVQGKCEMIKYVFFLGTPLYKLLTIRMCSWLNMIFFSQLSGNAVRGVDKLVGKLAHRLWRFAAEALQMIGGDCAHGAARTRTSV